MKQNTVWKPRPSDPELEIEFLRRLMVRLGAPSAQAQQASAAASAASVRPAANVASLDGQPTLLLQDTLERAWRRAGLALDRSGFTVEDRDRSKGLFFVRYVPPGSDRQEPGFFARLLSSKPQSPGLMRYQIQLRAVGGEQVRLNVLSQEGRPEASENADRILKLLAAELR